MIVLGAVTSLELRKSRLAYRLHSFKICDPGHPRASLFTWWKVHNTNHGRNEQFARERGKSARVAASNGATFPATSHRRKESALHARSQVFGRPCNRHHSYVLANHEQSAVWHTEAATCRTRHALDSHGRSCRRLHEDNINYIVQKTNADVQVQAACEIEDCSRASQLVSRAFADFFWTRYACAHVR